MPPTLALPFLGSQPRSRYSTTLGFGWALTALTSAPPFGFVSVGIRLLWRSFETRFERFKCVSPITFQHCSQFGGATRPITPEHRSCVRLVQRRAFSLEQSGLRRRRLIGERTIEIRPRLGQVAERRVQIRVRCERIGVPSENLTLWNRVELVEAHTRP